MELRDIVIRPCAFFTIVCNMALFLIPLLQCLLLHSSAAPALSCLSTWVKELLCWPYCQGKQREPISYGLDDGSQRRKPRCYQRLPAVYENWQKTRSV